MIPTDPLPSQWYPLLLMAVFPSKRTVAWRLLGSYCDPYQVACGVSGVESTMTPLPATEPLPVMQPLPAQHLFDVIVIV